MSRRIRKFLRNQLPIVMVLAMLAGFLPSAPVRANEGTAKELLPQVNQVAKQQLFAETVAGSELSWSALNLVDKGILTTFYQSEKPTAKLSSDERYVAINRFHLPNANPLDMTEVITIYDRVRGGTYHIAAPDTFINGSILDFDMSDDAQFIVFSFQERSMDENVNVYLYDRQKEELKVITPVAGENVYGDHANRVSISSDGRYIAFDSDARGLVPEDQDPYRDVFVYDRLATDEKLKRISTWPDLEPDDRGHSSSPSISSNGQYIAFQSISNFTKDENESATPDIYIYDKENVATPFTKVSKGLGGVDADGASFQPTISADGQAVAFLSEATNLVAGEDENYQADLFVFAGSAIKRLSALPPIVDPADLDRWQIAKPSISPDGKFVGYELHENTDEDELVDAYVASVETGNSTKVSVPNMPFKMVNPNHSPVVGAGARTVVFYSMYERTFAGNTVMDFPGAFIAAQGSVPVWSPGSTLQATEENGSITLSWPDASDASGIVGYQIFKNDAVVGYVPFADANTFTVTGLEEGHFYQFQVEAVNSQYNISYGGPSYTTGSENPPVDVLLLSWDADRSKNGLPLIGSTVTLNAYAKTGLQGEGTLTYQVLKDGVAETKTVTLNFTESEQTGSYTTTFTIPEGTIELTSFTVKFIDPATQEETDQTMSEWPLKIGGNLTISFENPGHANLDGAYLSVRSNRLGGEFIVLDGDEPITIEGLYPDEEYTATLYSAGTMRVLSQQGGLKVGSGQKKDATLRVVAPANLRFQMVDKEGNPIENIGVQLYDSNQEYLGSYTTDQDGWTYYFGNLTAGDQVTAKIDIGDYMFQKVSDQIITLNEGDNEKRITLSSLPIGVLEGVVTNSNNEPVMNAIVTMEQTVDGKKVVKQTHSSLNGHYKFDSVFAGEVSVEAAEPSNKYKTENKLTAKIEAEKTTNLPITVSQPKTGIINLKVSLKYIDSEVMGPVDMSQMPFLVRIQYEGGGWHTGYYQNAYYYNGYPNGKVKVCVTATTPSFTTQCKDVTVDDKLNATAEFLFEEIGGRIQGSLAKTDHYYVYGNLYKLQGDSKSWERGLGREEFRTGQFDINIMEPGKYRMELIRMLTTTDVRYEYATVDFTVEDQKITQLETIGFSSTSYFANMYGNAFSVISNQVFPGSTATFRVSYQNVKDKEAKDTSLIVSIPDDMTLVKDRNGRIVVNGIQTEAVLEGKNLTIPLGDLAPKQAGTVSYQLKVAPTFNDNNVSTSARIQTKIDGAAIDETIGTILLDTPQVSIEVPERLSSLQPEISGHAPAGRTVKIYDGNVLVGSALSSSTGFWRTTVQLPDIGNPSTHALHAETTSSSVDLRSITVYPEYDTATPKLLEMAMAQAPDGKWVTLEVAKGISRQPYTVVPGYPFQFELKFDRPDDVENVYVYLGGQTGKAVKAVRDGAIYRAVTPTGVEALGGIYVSFDEKKKPYTPDNRIPTLEEIRQSMPPDMRDFEVVSTTPFELKNGKYSGQVKIKFPQLDDMIMTVTLSIQPNVNYQVSAQEIAWAEQSGLPMLNSSITETETKDSLTTVLEGYVPMDLLFPEGLPGTVRSASNSNGQYGWDAVGHFTTEATMEFTDVLKTGNDIRKSFNDYKDFSSRINKIMYNVQRGFDCFAEVPTTVNEAGKALVAVVGGEIAKVALGAWTGAMGLAGAPGIAAAVAVSVAEGKIDDYVDSKIDAIGSGYNECKEDDRKRKKVADPKWIYDPSGYVYEAIPENRLEGVKATVLYLDPDSNTWVVWDAGPYEQINPQSTNSEGKYGWDVPPGKWKVVWEKEGYETRTSSELDVPPPHTDVNAGIISRMAPQVEKAVGVLSQTGSYVDITFTKYLTVSDLPNNALTVIGPDGKNIAGTSKFVSTTTNPGKTGSFLSKTVRFETESILSLEKTYQLKVNPSFFKSYADVWMKNEFTGSFTVMEEDVTGPTPIEASVNGMLITVQFDEPVGLSADLEKFIVNGKAGVVTSAVTDVDDKRVMYLSLNEQYPNSQPVEITVLAGAISDVKGNLSVEKKLAVSMASASSNALLGGIAVDSAALSPSFDPERLAYTVRVANSVKHLQITASSVDSKAKIIIEGMEAVSGVTKTVLIPESDGISINVTAEDGTTTKTYTIQVNRQQDQGGGNPGGPGPIVTPPPTPPVGNPLDLGKDANIEKKKDSDGRINLHISLSKEAVANALKSRGTGTEPLFVEVKEQADKYVLQLSKDILELLEKDKAAFELKMNMVQATIPAGAFDLSSLSDGSDVNVILSKSSDQEKKSLVETAVLQSGGALKPVGEVITFGLLASEGAALKLKNDLVIEWPVIANSKEAVYRYDSTSKKWTFVQTEGSMYLNKPGIFAVWTYENTFGDLNNHWARSEIEWMAQRLMVQGYSNDKFKPEKAVTRAEFTAILVRALGLTKSESKKVGHFVDVNKTSWYYEAVETAASLGIIEGKHNGTFGPNDPITREQMTVMIWRMYTMLGLADASTGDLTLLNSFKDKKNIRKQFANEIALALEVGLVYGKSNSIFDPKGIATRAQSVVMIRRLLEKHLQK